MHWMFRKIILLLSFSVLASPFLASAAAFEYSGWLPFWRKMSGLREITPYSKQINSLSPFSYEVNKDGSLVDKAGIANDPVWLTWLSAGQDLGMKIIPSVAWFDGEGLHSMLSSKSKRTAHINAIVKLVREKKFNGIDIDYENKKAETKPYFSAFIKELSAALKKYKKTLTCTVEPRTPDKDRFKVIPKDLGYANDYAVLNKYCDEVRVMAYDQGRYDLTLNDTNKSVMYAPVADPKWVEKVIGEVLKEVSAKKVVLGVPTYGYEWQLTPNGTSTSYMRLRAHTYKTATERMSSLGLSASRSSAGELFFSYTTSTLVTATTTVPNIPNITRYVTFTDKEAMQAKINLAKKMKLRGVIFFKFDGENDPELWKLMKK